MDDQSNVLSIIREFLDQKYIQKYGVHLTSHWKFQQEFNIPTQKNSYDCSVFLCKIAHHKSLNSDSFDFLAKDMGFYRNNIFQSRVDNPPDPQYFFLALINYIFVPRNVSDVLLSFYSWFTAQNVQRSAPLHLFSYFLNDI
ncbi:hypothetical protein BpHYR1_034599 [Brachionus plicatilis]|uniref:Ubiquitin-like protease family profile domain-containing protein n=1 Tax=Brachionus plicatilis TaxID=10195 RepID=A0A3M7SZR1_BRAPC|nr:hypothetical protein BpHYR1_034599 [Brachionus plicatilis]